MKRMSSKWGFIIAASIIVDVGLFTAHPLLGFVGLGLVVLSVASWIDSK